MQIDAATATVIAAIVGAGVGGLVTLLGQWLTRRSEERRHLRQLVIQTAIENWRFTSEAAEKMAAAGYPVDRYPLDSFLLHMLKLSELLNERDITPELARQKLREVYAVTEAAGDEIRRHSASEPEERPNQSLAVPIPSFPMTSTFSLQITLALTSGGSAPSR